MRQAFWTVKDGQVVTAHVNREGQEVDHRPPAIVEAEKNYRYNRFTLTLHPQRGVNVAPLLLETTLRSQPRPDQVGAPAGYILVEHFLDSEYQGAVVTKPLVGTPWDLPYVEEAPGEEAAALRDFREKERKEALAKDEAIRARQEARKEAVKAQVDGLVTARNGKTLLSLLNLNNDVKSLAMSDVLAVEKAVLRVNARPSGLDWREDEPLGYLVKEVIRLRRDSSAIYALLLEAARSLFEQERASKKAAWIASKTA